MSRGRPGSSASFSSNSAENTHHIND